MYIEGSPNFVMLKPKTISLIPIFDKYSFFDLTLGVFCINSWIDNRSALENGLALNNALININQFGDKSISTYNEFRDFFQEIQQLLPISPMDDNICKDFGEVRLRFNDKFYPVILGTGHENVFSALGFLPYVSKYSEHNMLTIACLEYVELLINTLSQYNKSIHEDNEIRFECPTEAYYNSVKRFFSTDFILGIDPQLISLFDQKIGVEKCHFICKGSTPYPLFSASLLIDLFSYLVSHMATDQLDEVIMLTISTKIHSIYNTKGPGNPAVLWPAVLMQKHENLCSNPYSFVALAENKVIVAICESNYTESELEREIANIVYAHKKNELVACEAVKRNSSDGYNAVNISDETELYFILYNNYINISETFFMFGARNEGYFRCSALDLFFLVCFANDLNEICDYIDYSLNEEAKIVVIGGECNVFCNWKMQDKMFSKGAVNYSMLHVSYGAADDFVFDYYINQLKYYPFNINVHMFYDPFGWDIKFNEENDISYSSKSEKGFWGTGYNLDNGGFIFYTHYLQHYDINKLDEHEIMNLRTIGELHSKLTTLYKEVLSKVALLDNLFLQIAYLPWEYAKLVDNTGFLHSTDSSYVFSEISWQGDHPIIRYSVNFDALITAINNADNKSIESQYFYEMYLPLIKDYPEDFAELTSLLKEDSKKKKSVDVIALKIPFYMSDHNKHFKLEVEALHLVRKRIAQICSESDIPTGKYLCKDATKIIRSMQEKLVQDFEREIAKYNLMALHQIALSLHATSAIETFIHNKRFSGFSDVDESILEQVKDKTIEYREESRRKQRYLIYLIESNLSVERKTDTVCTQKQLNYIIAYANWMQVLQENADYCYYNNTGVFVDITFEYIVNIEVSSDEEERNNSIIKRVYSNIDYSINDDSIDDKYFEKAKFAFQNDIGCDFSNFCSLLHYLSREFTAMNEDAYEILPNVFRVKKANIIYDFNEALVRKLDAGHIESMIDYLTVNVGRLKEWKGEIILCLPIWERENRDNRLEIKPLVAQDEYMLFSPIMCYDLLRRWIYGLPRFYLPYEIGLETLKNILVDWKKRYEDQMVVDICALFSHMHLEYVKSEVKLHKNDKQGSHPKELGDYDVIAVDSTRSIIYLIESKVIQKVGSIYEFSMQQKYFFFHEKYDELFQARIDYMKENHRRFFESQGINTKNFQVQPYMVVNKVFFANEKIVDFPIVSFYELEQLLRSAQQMQ
jgi:hypothetical protein